MVRPLNRIASVILVAAIVPLRTATPQSVEPSLPSVSGKFSQDASKPSLDQVSHAVALATDYWSARVGRTVNSSTRLTLALVERVLPTTLSATRGPCTHWLWPIGHTPIRKW